MFTSPATTPAIAPPGPRPELLQAQQLVRAGIAEFATVGQKLNPVMPMWLDVDDMRYVDMAGALRHAGLGMADIDAARQLGPMLSPQLDRVLQSAAADARTGQQLLRDAYKGITPGFDRLATAGHFDAAGNWLSIADSLIRLELGSDLPPTPPAT
jgi:hypothetical protein